MPIWWERPGLEVRDGRLLLGGRDVEGVAREHGTPVYAYDLVRIREQADALRAAFDSRGLDLRLRLALKAQRDPEVLAFVRALGSVGVDACSPGEVAHALDHGWAPDEISVTATNLSDRDMAELAATGVHVNLDLLSQLDRWGRHAPGSTIGVRVNPRAGASWSGLAKATAGESLYAGAKPTKFGVLREQLDDALAVAEKHGLQIDTVHAHVGDGFLTDGLPELEVAIERVAGMARHVAGAGHPLAEANAGGGLGVPQRPGESPLGLDAYVEVLGRHLGPLGVAIGVEPGDFLCKESGVLLVEVVTLDERDGVWFAGVDAGFNVAPEHFIYGAELPIVLARAADAEPTTTYTVAGNINEGDDLWSEALPLPELREGDVLAFLGVGTYNRSMHLDHCLRPPARTAAFDDRID
ncbi:MAG TPA: diaminopimelate decarboxylase [Actinomycetota bacterium]|nr:diaminopimelate decarboxylase [Actinomycetota bacterium]